MSFPKSHDISKAIDKAAGAEREVVGRKHNAEEIMRRSRGGALKNDGWDRPWRSDDAAVSARADITAPATDAARQWSGWGTALKPAWEPIILVRKPRRGTYAECAVEHGAGALWVDGCRIATDIDEPNARENKGGDGPTDGIVFQHRSSGKWDGQPGRWPANVLLSHSEGCVKVGTKRVRGSHRTGLKEGEVRLYGTNSWFGGGLIDLGTDYTDPDGLETIEDWECVEDCPIRLLNEQAGPRRNPGSPGRQAIYPPGKTVTYGRWHPQGPLYFDAGEKGNASRFFYTAKSSRRERNAGLEGLEVLKLRDDLTGDEMSFVLSELERLGVKPLQQ